MKKTLLSLATIASVWLSAQQLNLLKNQDQKNYGHAYFEYVNAKKSFKALRGIGKADATLVLKDNELNTINETLVKNYGDNLLHYGTYINDDKIAIVPFSPAKEYIHFTARAKYRLYDLKTNTLSEPTPLPGNYSQKHIIKDFYSMKDGFMAVTNEFSMPNPYTGGVSYKKDFVFTGIDNNNNKIWDYTLSPNKTINATGIGYQKVQSNQDLIFIPTINFAKGGVDYQEIILVDSKTGTEVARKLVKDTENHYFIESTNFHEDNAYSTGVTFPWDKRNVGKYTGLFAMKMDKKGEMTIKNFSWDDLKKHINVDEKGYVKDKGYIFIHDLSVDPKTKNVILIGEFFHKQGSSFYVSNFIFFELDPQLNLISIKDLPKEENFYYTDQLLETSRSLARSFYNRGHFDYMFVNKLNDDAGLAFFHYNQPKRKEHIDKETEHSYGVVIYKDGKFSTDNLSFDAKTPTSIMQGKPGSFVVIQSSKEGDEIRLEKINH